MGIAQILDRLDNDGAEIERRFSTRVQGMYEEDEEDEEDGIVVDEEDEGDEGIVPEPIHVEETGDEGTIPNGTNVAEDRHEGTVPEGINVDAEDDEGTVPDGINVEDETIYEEGENDKRAENDSEDSEDPEFYDSAYDQNEGEKSDDMAISDVNSLDSSSCDEVELPMRKKEEETAQESSEKLLSVQQKED
ncbi:unnamed protein product [Prunus armeniaca]